MIEFINWNHRIPGCEHWDSHGVEHKKNLLKLLCVGDSFCVALCICGVLQNSQ